jgi:hypothetical protein
MRHRTWIATTAGILAIAGCSSGGEKATCADDSGAKVCVVSQSSGARHIEMTGFQAGSKVQLTSPGRTAADAPSSTEVVVGADGAYPSGGGVFGLVGGNEGPATATFTFSGTAVSGSPVELALLLKR